MSINEAAGPAPETLTALNGSIFLNPEFVVDSHFLDQISSREDLQTDSDVARLDLRVYSVVHSPQLIESTYTKMLRGDVLKPDERDMVGTLHRLQEKIDAPGVFWARVSYEADRLANALLAFAAPGDIAVGGSNYQLVQGAWQRVWLCKTDPETNQTRVFGRLDAISEDEGVQNVSRDDQLQLILDIASEREKNVGQYGLPEEVVPEQPLLLSRADEKNSVRYPYISHPIHNSSLRFYNDFEDLLAEGFATVTSFGWRDGSVVTADEANAQRVEIAIDARAYVADQNLRIDDKSRYFDGPANFTWLVTKYSDEGAELMGFETQGALVRPLPTHRHNKEGDLIGVSSPSAAEVTGVWELIQAGISSKIFADQVATLRNAEYKNVVVPTVKGQRPPKKAYVPQGFGFPAKLPEYAPTAISDLKQLQVSRFIGGMIKFTQTP